MGEKYLCIMAGYDDETSTKLEAFRQQVINAGFLGTQTTGIPHHITLGTFPVDKECELIAQIQEIAAAADAFPVTFNHIGIFQGSKVLFIQPDSSHELLTLQSSFGTNYGWTPHTTMLIDEPENVVKAVPALLRNFSAFGGKVTQLHLYEFWPTRHILTVNLGCED